MENYDRIFEKIDTAIKNYVRNKSAPLATLRHITRLVEAANDYRQAREAALFAMQDEKDAEKDLKEAREKNRLAQARATDTHNALEDILGGPK